METILSSKLRIRVGEVEIDYEGTEEFLKDEIPELLKTALELHRASGHAAAGAKPNSGSGTPDRKVGDLTTGSIAAKLEAKSGGDLLKAAAAHLALVAHKDRFSRQQLLDEMKNASHYYKKSFNANLTSYIKAALQRDGCLSEVATDMYALNAATRQELEKTLADN